MPNYDKINGMKKIALLIFIALLTNAAVFAEKITVEVDVSGGEIPTIPVNDNRDSFTQIYCSIGTSAMSSFGETLITYIANQNDGRDNVYVPYLYAAHAGFDFFISKFIGFGLEGTYENGIYKSDYDSNRPDFFCSKYGVLGKFTFSPSKYIYTSLSLGAMFKSSEEYENWLLVLPAINYCPFGVRLPITNHFMTYFEFNIGSVSCFDVGLSIMF